MGGVPGRPQWCRARPQPPSSCWPWWPSQSLYWPTRNKASPRHPILVRPSNHARSGLSGWTPRPSSCTRSASSCPCGHPPSCSTGCRPTFAGSRLQRLVVPRRSSLVRRSPGVAFAKRPGAAASATARLLPAPSTPCVRSEFNRRRRRGNHWGQRRIRSVTPECLGDRRPGQKQRRGPCRGLRRLPGAAHFGTDLKLGDQQVPRLDHPGISTDYCLEASALGGRLEDGAGCKHRKRPAHRGHVCGLHLELEHHGRQPKHRHRRNPIKRTT